MGGAFLILLDTHVWIWSNAEPGRLPASVAKALQEPGVELAVSAISVWEAIMAAQRGRMQTQLPPVETARALIAATGAVVYPVDTEIAVLARTLEFLHSDPADRFIAATAYCLRCPLATVDEKLVDLPWLRIVR